jgi:uncharacterized protein (TIGR02246 family)
MKTHALVLLAGLVCLVYGCSRGNKVDIEAEKAALRQADTDWAATLAAKDLDGFLGYFAPDAVVLPPHLPAMNGAEAIRQWATTSFNFPGFAVTWNVTSVEVAAAGDMGYTLGDFTFHVEFDGTPLDDHGKYVTNWKKQADGTWKVVVDAFNSDVEFMPPPGTAPADTAGAQGQ